MNERYNFKEVMSKPERLAPGHRMCAGCGATIAAVPSCARFKTEIKP